MTNQTMITLLSQGFLRTLAIFFLTLLGSLPLGLLVILPGHLLNVAMAMMSVLVHGIRLNTLEFSGHIGVEWGGRAYRPFREN